MFSRIRAANAFYVFSRGRQDEESPLATGLLHDTPPEIELSDYGRVQVPGNESPSDLLNGESLNVELISDLDLFFERLYNYYCDKGLWCIITKWIVELLSLSFTILFSGFFLLFVDWNGLRNAKCGMDAVERGVKPCDLAKEALHQHPITPFTFSKAVIIGYLGIFSIYWVFCFFRFFAQLKHVLGIRHFYYNSLHVSDSDINTMPWASILEKVVQLQNSQRLCVVKDLSEHDIVMRLMRKENYLIGMLNKGVLGFPISVWLPGCGPAIRVGQDRGKKYLMLTKTLEWTLNWCVLHSMFDRNCCVKSDFVSNPNMLKRRLMIAGFAMLFLSPFLVIFMLVYLFLRHAEHLYNHPSMASSRRWSNLSKWIFREYNEVDHLFKHRINSSVRYASDYLKQFPSPIISIIAKFVSFVAGGFAAILIIIAFLEESLLEGHIFGRNLLWYAAVFGTITAVSRAAIDDEILVLDPQGAMSLVVQHTHHMPKRWRGKENNETVKLEFTTLFQYTGMMLVEEMASIFLTPYLLLFVVPKRVNDILQFISDFTVHVEGVGHVCSFSIFDFQNHGNGKYASPVNASFDRRSSQGKMEKSFLSFCSSYPSWEPPSLGTRFLSALGTFRDDRTTTEARCAPARLYSVPEWVTNSTLRRSQVASSAVDNNSSPSYILDWYYASSQPLDSGGDAHFTDFTLPFNGTRYDWMNTATMEASATASTFMGDSIRISALNDGLRQDGLRQDRREQSVYGQWWARDVNRREGYSSFLEPPDFNTNSPHPHRFGEEPSSGIGREIGLPFDDVFPRMADPSDDNST